MWAIIREVVVLPLVPVTATTGTRRRAGSWGRPARTSRHGLPRSLRRAPRRRGRQRVERVGTARRAPAPGRRLRHGRRPRSVHVHWSGAPGPRASGARPPPRSRRTSRRPRPANRCRKPRRIPPGGLGAARPAARRRGRSSALARSSRRGSASPRPAGSRGWGLRGPGARRGGRRSPRGHQRHRDASGPIAWKPPSTWTISPVVAGKKSLSSARRPARSASGPSRPSPAARGRSTSTRGPRSPGSPWRPAS